MEWWIWAAAIGAAVFLVIDWFIVMGTNPRDWKGGVQDDRNKRPDR